MGRINRGLTETQDACSLSGDSDGNVMVWKGVKVVRVLKGAHTGSVGHIAIFEDGTVISGGEKDGAIVLFR